MKYFDGKQHICFSIDELFAWQDRLDELDIYQGWRHPAWKLFDEFLNEAEDQLEYSDEFLAEMEEIHRKIEAGDYSDFVKFEFGEFCEKFKPPKEE